MPWCQKSSIFDRVICQLEARAYALMLRTQTLHAELHYSGRNSCCFSRTANVHCQHHSQCAAVMLKKQGSISAAMADFVSDRQDIADKAYEQNSCWLQAQKEAQKEKAKEEKEQQRLAKEAEKERLR